MRRFLRLIPILLLIGLQVETLRATSVHAQDVQWEERRTLLFSILYPSGAEDTAEQYAQFVDGVYEEMSAFWGYRPSPPIVLRIYPTMELYYQANPLAAKLPGVIAHAHTGRREISVAIPQTAGQSDEEIRNNVRHELTHVIAADLSGGRLTTAWQEGIAQYVEHPTEQLERKMELMRQIVAENRLLSWRELNQPGVAYSDPRIGYPQSLTIVAFLIQRNGIERFRAIVEETTTASGYRGALEAIYGVPADVLEQEWLDQLPAFISEGYQQLAPGAAGRGPFDLSQPEQLIAQGDYIGAINMLRPMLEAIRSSGDGEALQRGNELLAQAQARYRATKLASDAREALVRGDYRAAHEAAVEAERELVTLGLTDQATSAAQYAELAARGLRAQEQYAEAGQLLRGLEIRAAQRHLTEAYTAFGELGDEARARQSQRALGMISRGEQVLAAICLLSGAGLIAWSGRRRQIERRIALPFT
jgi:hypothetical protein